MLYIRFNGGLPCEISTGYPVPDVVGGGRQWGRENGWVSARDAESFVEAETWARYITAMTGDAYLPVDNTESTYPRFEVIRAPKIGDPVSYGFNGDYTPDGVIVKISPKWMITTSTGHTYRRKGLRKSWLQPGGTWGLVDGHIDERNPHF
jgi:hypothetical protein